MFDYEIAGKQAIIVLHQEALEHLKSIGIESSPIYATILRVDQSGLWLDNPFFALCPVDQPKLYRPTGEMFCHAHIFIPSAAIISLAIFPKKIESLDLPNVKNIGFQLPKPPPPLVSGRDKQRRKSSDSR